jgi:hypothetical protein
MVVIFYRKNITVVDIFLLSTFISIKFNIPFCLCGARRNSGGDAPGNPASGRLLQPVPRD